MSPAAPFRKLKTARSLSAAQWKAFFEAYLLLLQVRLLLFLRPAAIVERGLRGFPLRRAPEGLPRAELVGLFQAARRWQPADPLCLASSLALQKFLHRHGFASEFSIGVRKEGDGLSAHAWCRDPRRNEPPAGPFVPLEQGR